MRLIQRHPRQRAEQGNALLVTQVVILVLVGFAAGTLQTISSNSKAMRQSLDLGRARYATLSAIHLAIEKLDDPIERLTNPGTVGDIQGALDSANGLILKPFTAALLPTDADMLAQPNGSFAVICEAIPDGDGDPTNDPYKIRAVARWGEYNVRLLTVVVPEPARPFQLGINGLNGVSVQGSGLIDWTNSNNPADTVVPRVVETDSGAIAIGITVIGN